MKKIRAVGDFRVIRSGLIELIYTSEFNSDIFTSYKSDPEKFIERNFLKLGVAEVSRKRNPRVKFHKIPV